MKNGAEYLGIRPLGVHPYVWLGGLVLVLLFVVFGIGYLERRKARGRATRFTGQVSIVVGRLGSGKSMFALREAWTRIQGGAMVYTNFSMNLPEKYQHQWRRFEGWDDLLSIRKAVVIIDEADLLADASKSINFPDEAKWKLKMARKSELDLYMITQHEQRLNNKVRILANYIYVCNSYRDGSYFKVRCYEPEDVRKEGKELRVMRYKFDPFIAGLYDTLEMITGDEGTRAGRDGIRAAAARLNGQELELDAAEVEPAPDGEWLWQRRMPRYKKPSRSKSMPQPGRTVQRR